MVMLKQNTLEKKIVDKIREHKAKKKKGENIKIS
jgi:hypothetical protein